MNAGTIWLLLPTNFSLVLSNSVNGNVFLLAYLLLSGPWPLFRDAGMDYPVLHHNSSMNDTLSN